jgi:peptide/nickel transport system permease protein
MRSVPGNLNGGMTGQRVLKHFLMYLKAHPSALVGTLVILVYLIVTLLAPTIAPFDPVTPTSEFRTPPSVRHWFGTDLTGLDVFSRVIYAGRTDLTVGVVGTTISLVLGVPIGLLVGYYRGFTSGLVLRMADLLQAFPVFVLAMAMVAVAGPSIRNVILVIGILNVPVYVRLVRSEVLTFRERTVTEAARCVGNSNSAIIRNYLFPNTIEPALVQASVNVGWAILMTASLSFIGAGVPVPTPEWGSMVGIGAPMMMIGQWWAAFFPGMAIGICVLAFALFADAIRVVVNPERRH